MTDRARSEFNTWWERQPFKDQFADVKEQMGNVWVASREECVVELPDGCICCYEDAEREMLQACAEAIEASGLRVAQ